MGVDIGVLKNLVKVSDDIDNVDYDYLDATYEHFVIVRDKDEDITPYKRGVYSYEVGENHTQFSYGGNCDFLESLEKIGDETGYPFSVTINSAGIENCVSYVVAEQMLKEFEVNEEEAIKYLGKFDDFYVERYRTYIKILKECVECEGLLRYS